MQITHILTPLVPPWNPLMVVTIMNHNLVLGDYIRVSGVVGIVMAGTGIYQIFALTRNTITFFTGGPSLGIYLGGGYVSRVSRIDILSKQWNFYNDKASNVFVSKIDFCVDRTENGEITVGFLSSSSTVDLQADAVINNCALGNNILETSPYAIMPLEATQDRLWHPIYFQAEGENVQIRIRYSDEQMANPLIDASAFELEAIVVHAQKTGSRFE